MICVPKINLFVGSNRYPFVCLKRVSLVSRKAGCEVSGVEVVPSIDFRAGGNMQSDLNDTACPVGGFISPPNTKLSQDMIDHLRPRLIHLHMHAHKICIPKVMVCWVSHKYSNVLKAKKIKSVD